MAADLSALRAVPLFATVDENRLQELAARWTLRTVADGEVVAARGEPSDHLIVVETGGLTAMYHAEDGTRLRLGEFRAPCAVDKAAVLDGLGYTATWTATWRSRVRLVPRVDLMRLVDDVPAVRQHVLAQLAQTVRVRQGDVVRNALASTLTRTAAWLVDAAGETGRRVVLPGAQQGLAEAIGASRVSVNRALRRLAAEGLVRVEPGAVTVLAPELLARRARIAGVDGAGP